MFALPPHTHGRGAALIVEHCAALARLDDYRAEPFVRVEALVGPALARLLVHGLASRPQRRAA